GLPSYCEKFVSGTGTYSSYAACFVCKKPEWKGGFIMLGTGTTAGYFAGYDANYYSMLTPYPYSVNARLEMNAMAYIVKQNRINDINQPNPKPVPINP
ncbi:MAG: hypothetical protein LBR64_00640, partial [Dysgonamonadaceae bacterium]|nr:hypothetical protein [Dysgonamonadaceae bacterium]